MALYLGNYKANINIDGVLYNLNFISPTLILNGIRLLSSEGYTLRDCNGLYLTARESE